MSHITTGSPSRLWLIRHISRVDGSQQVREGGAQGVPPADTATPAHPGGRCPREVGPVGGRSDLPTTSG
ncbi:hypothetical protein TOK_4018 [Pseudonocardia sp. N23]|nr:hypothetical protein TOK_4018 [Pseudonocardia sp. N23]